MQIQLSDKFNYSRILRFTMPSVLMLVFTSIYGVVDGFFVSNFVNKTAFTAINFIWPYMMILGAAGFMLGTGGSALISKILGEDGGDSKRANKTFSMLIYVSIAVGIILALTGIFTVRPVAALLGAEGAMLEDCVLYGIVLSISLPAFLLQNMFQSLFVTAEKPKLGLYVTVIAGVANMVLDALLVAVFPMGLLGAALATASSQVLGGIIPLFYFARKNGSLLRLVPALPDFPALGRICFNGSSELLSNISMSVVGMLYNAQLMHYAGEDGVAAYGVLMYVNFIFISAFIGYAVGISPVVGYHYGAGNTDELKSLRRKSTVIILITSVAMFALSELLAYPLSYMFVGYDEALLNMTLRGFTIYSFCFLFAGLAIFISSFFTALNDGLTSAILSFARTIVIQVAGVLLLPIWLHLDGIWLSVVISDLLSMLLGIAFLLAYKRKYSY
ncbi:MAG: MATE family efflux transporter [Clostridia bacterium]|nr:MATE family efflux transporter [Clostridia bacterium]